MIHVGIIPDGNRRWCKQNGKSKLEYSQLMQAMIRAGVTDYKDKAAKDAPYESFKMVDELSIFILSKDNLVKRDGDILELVGDMLNLICSLLRLEENATKFKFDVYGDIHLLPNHMQSQIQDCIAHSHGTMPVHLAIAYDPISDSADYLAKGISTRRPIDLVIRSGGELRSSGFFPLQTLYSEWIYLNDFWPDVDQHKLNDCLDEFTRRTRNFGK